MNYDILNTIGPKFTPRAKVILEGIGKVNYLDLTQKELEARIDQYDILVVGLGLNITKGVIEKGRNLIIIATATTGLDHIDIEYAKEKNIQVISLKGETEFLDTITGTAELACGLMIDLMRQLPHSFESVKRYEWEREAFRGHNLYGQTLGIVGLGRLGGWMARYGKAFGMKVLAFDPQIENGAFKKNDCQKATFEQLLEESDVVSIHVHLNAETEGMFNRSVFKQMKKSAYLINTARGKIVNEGDLLKALKGGEIAGCATDVLADELAFNMRFSKHPLVEYAKVHRNLIIVPHIGGMTHETRAATDIFISKKLLRIYDLS